MKKSTLGSFFGFNERKLNFSSDVSRRLLYDFYVTKFSKYCIVSCSILNLTHIPSRRSYTMHLPWLFTESKSFYSFIDNLCCVYNSYRQKSHSNVSFCTLTQYVRGSCKRSKKIKLVF